MPAPHCAEIFRNGARLIHNPEPLQSRACIFPVSTFYSSTHSAWLPAPFCTTFMHHLPMHHSRLDVRGNENVPGKYVILPQLCKKFTFAFHKFLTGQALRRTSCPFSF